MSDFASQFASFKQTAAATASASKRQRPHHDEERSKRTHRRQSRFRNHYAIEKALESLPQYKPCPSPTQRSTKHLALLFITIDDLPHEGIWRRWISNQENEHNMFISVLVHAKFPLRVRSEWLKQRLLVDLPPKRGRGNEYAPPRYFSRCPKWGSIEITRAMLDLVHEGLKIGTSDDIYRDPRFSCNRFQVCGSSERSMPAVDKFIFLSETCLPVATLKQVDTALFGEDDNALVNTSWVKGFNDPKGKGGYVNQQFNSIDAVVPESCRWKADQWIVLSRAHAISVMDLDKKLPRDVYLWQCFRDPDLKASDELYFPTALALRGIMGSNELIQRRVTYADWEGETKNPKSFAANELRGVAKLAREEGCLFARKFTGAITVEEWEGCNQDLQEGAEANSS